MIVKTKDEEKIIKEACNISMNILKKLGDSIKEHTTPLLIDKLAERLCKENNVKAAFKGVSGYKYNTCISVNDVAVHGIPKDIPLKKGDLVSIDFGIIYKGYYTDHCWTWSIGEPDRKNEKLLRAGRRAVENAIQKAVVGNKIGDLGYEMESEAHRNGFNTLSVFIGHGIGKTLHEEPDIPAFGRKNKGNVLKDGMVICIECQVVDDVDRVYEDSDGWSARTVNGGNSVMFEYMVIVRKDNPEILTNTLNWSTVV
ncbi:MAG: type I methionyl aminopeptidase [Candidatus Dojkabacteria bacterium]|nr:type I methionyl aminopeptidase [Candidatus Dojkabacteria bacterium]